MARKKWTCEMVIKFLEGYEQNRCLWDVHNKLYKNRDARESAYENLSKTMGIEDFHTMDVKAKIRSIRNTYLLELTKIRKSKRSGAGAGDVYKPKVPWFPVADRILRGIVHIRASQTPLIIQTESQSESMQLIDLTQSIKVNDGISAFQKESVAVTTKRPKRPASIDFVPKKISKRSRGTSTENAVEEFAHKSVENPTVEDENEFDCFGKSVACQLKKLSEAVALESIAYIQTYLVQQRLKSNRNKKIYVNLRSVHSQTVSVRSHE